MLECIGPAVNLQQMSAREGFESVAKRSGNLRIELNRVLS